MRLSVLTGIIVLAFATGAVIITIDHVPNTPFRSSQTATSTSSVSTSTQSTTTSMSIQTATTSGAENSSRLLTITSVDTGTTIYLHPSDRFLLNLGGELNWSNLAIDDESIVSKVEGAPVSAGAQGVYEAYGKGATTLTAIGAPACPAEKACPSYAILFKVEIVVD